MRSVVISVAGVANSQNPWKILVINKTLPQSRRLVSRSVRKRNEESCGDRGWIVIAEIIVKPVVVPVPPVVVPVEVTDIEVARVAVSYGSSSMPPPLEYSRG